MNYEVTLYFFVQLLDANWHWLADWRVTGCLPLFLMISPQSRRIYPDLISHCSGLSVNLHLVLLDFLKKKWCKNPIDSGPAWTATALMLLCYMHANCSTVSHRLTVWLFNSLIIMTLVVRLLFISLNNNLSGSKDQSSKLLVPVSCQCLQLHCCYVPYYKLSNETPKDFFFRAWNERLTWHDWTIYMNNAKCTINWYQ